MIALINRLQCPHRQGCPACSIAAACLCNVCLTVSKCTGSLEWCCASLEWESCNCLSVSTESPCLCSHNRYLASARCLLCRRRWAGVILKNPPDDEHEVHKWYGWPKETGEQQWKPQSRPAIQSQWLAPQKRPPWSKYQEGDEKAKSVVAETETRIQRMRWRMQTQ